MNSVIAYLLARLKEPSSVAGLAGILTALHVGNADTVAGSVISIGIGTFSIAAIVMPEKK